MTGIMKLVLEKVNDVLHPYLYSGPISALLSIVEHLVRIERSIIAIGQYERILIFVLHSVFQV